MNFGPPSSDDQMFPIRGSECCSMAAAGLTVNSYADSHDFIGAMSTAHSPVTTRCCRVPAVPESLHLLSEGLGQLLKKARPGILRYVKSSLGSLKSTKLCMRQRPELRWYTWNVFDRVQGSLLVLRQTGAQLPNLVPVQQHRR